MKENNFYQYKSLNYWSKDDAFGLRLTNTNLEEMLKFCEKSYPNETGGILIGNYTKSLDCAEIKIITGPPKDSKFGRNWFKRGIEGLQKVIKYYWRKNLYYIGEWHFHPNGEPFPSEKDQKQLKLISKSQDYDCSAPILIIVGGNLSIDLNIRVFVFPYEDIFQELHSPNNDFNK